MAVVECADLVLCQTLELVLNLTNKFYFWLFLNKLQFSKVILNRWFIILGPLDFMYVIFYTSNAWNDKLVLVLVWQVCYDSFVKYIYIYIVSIYLGNWSFKKHVYDTWKLDAYLTFICYLFCPFIKMIPEFIKYYFDNCCE